MGWTYAARPRGARSTGIVGDKAPQDTVATMMRRSVPFISSARAASWRNARPTRSGRQAILAASRFQHRDELVLPRLGALTVGRWARLGMEPRKGSVAS